MKDTYQTREMSEIFQTKMSSRTNSNICAEGNDPLDNKEKTKGNNNNKATSKDKIINNNNIKTHNYRNKDNCKELSSKKK